MLSTTLCALLLTQVPLDKSLTPRLGASGAESGIRQEQSFMIESAKEWQTIWTRNRNFRSSVPEQAPAVDFKKEVVLFIARGEQFFVTGTKIQNLKVTKDEKLGLKVVVNAADTGFSRESEERRRQYPFGWAVLPRVEGVYQVRLDVWGRQTPPELLTSFDLRDKTPAPKPVAPPPPKSSKP